MSVACGINKVSSIARIFGIPTSVLESSYFDEAKLFLDELETPLKEYRELKKEVEENSDNLNKPTSSLSIGSLSYCIREFTLYLDEIDPKKKWCRLSRRIDEKGNVFFICSNCAMES